MSGLIDANLIGWRSNFIKIVFASHETETNKLKKFYLVKRRRKQGLVWVKAIIRAIHR